jgi:hypothetical protein
MKGAVGGKGVSETGKNDRERKGVLPDRFSESFTSLLYVYSRSEAFLWYVAYFFL